MTEKLQVYKCNICGNIVMVMHKGAGELVCCGQPMELLKEQTADFKTEKHVPVIEKSNGKTAVKVGSVPHPMEEKHYIEWIEAQTKDKLYIKFLKPGEKPEAEFNIEDDITSAREYCNIHKLWKST